PDGNGEAAAVAARRSREATALRARPTVTMILRMSGASTGSAKEDASCPACQTATPSAMDRQAEPEPGRARRLRSRGLRSRSNAAAAAVASGAQPEAEGARHAPAGTELGEPARDRS